MSAKKKNTTEKRKTFFLKTIYSGANTALGTIPYVVSCYNNLNASAINFLGIFVAIKNILASTKNIYKYYEKPNNEEPKLLLLTDWILIGLYVAYFVFFAIMFGLQNATLVQVSYFALFPIRDFISTVMYFVKVVRYSKEIETKAKK